MVQEEKYEGKAIYLCGICKFGYKDRQTAQSCEDFCSAHSSCSLEITKNAIKR